MAEKPSLIPVSHLRRFPLSLLLLIYALFFWRFGYDFGSSDQDEMLPWCYWLQDPTLYPKDWFVQHLAQSFNVRSVFVYSLSLFPDWLPLSVWIGLCFAVCWTVIVQYSYRISLAITRRPIAALFTPFLGFGLFYKLTWGSNDAVYPLFVPELVAWALALPTLWVMWERKWLKAGVLLGLATCFHLITGLTTGLVLGILVLWQVLETALHWQAGARFLGGYTLFAAPALIPLAWTQFFPAFPANPIAPSPFFLLVEFRLPLHHLLTGLTTARFIGFILLVVGGCFSFYYLQKNRPLRFQTFLKRFTFISLALISLSLIATHGFSSMLIAKFQLLKLAVWLKLFAVALIAGAGVEGLSKYMGFKAHFHPLAAETIHSQKQTLGVLALTQGWLKHWKIITWILAIIVWLGLIGMVLSGKGRAFQKFSPRSYAQHDLGQMEAWIAQNTPKTALFIVPPSNTSFRSHAKRSLYINWLSFPFEEAAMQTWYARLMQVSPLKSNTYAPTTAQLDAAFYDRSPAGWQHLVETARPDFLLIQGTALKAKLPFRLVQTKGDWQLFATDLNE